MQIITEMELANIERGLHDRLSDAGCSPSTAALTEVADYATRKLARMTIAYRELAKLTAKNQVTA